MDKEDREIEGDDERSALHPPVSAEDDLNADRPRRENRRVGAVSVERGEVSALGPAARVPSPVEARSDFVPHAPEPVGPHFGNRRKIPIVPSETYFTRHLKWWDTFVALLLGLIGCIAVAFTYDGFGHSWDEALYLLPGQKAADWVTKAVSDPAEMFTRDAITSHWGGDINSPDDPLHPEIAPLPKLMVGTGAALGGEIGVHPMNAIRLPIAVVFGLTLMLLYVLGAREYGRTGGFAAAIFYAFMPRVFGHAHIAASETLLAFSCVLLVWSFVRGTERGFFAIVCGTALALALATKVTALLLPIPLILWAQIYRRRDYGSNVFCMVFIAPLVLLMLWPWLWVNGPVRILQYVGYYITHQSTGVYYLGRKWGFGQPAAPWHYPSVIAALSLPEWALGFLALGLLRTVLRLRRRAVSVLFLLIALTVMGVASLPGVPKYDGERLFFASFAFIALLAAGGFAGLFSWGARRFDAKILQVHKAWAAGVLLFVIIAFGALDLFYAHPNELNYFNRLVGGTRGAKDRGFETSYWGETVNEKVLERLKEIARPGDRVKPLALNDLVFKHYQDWRDLPADVDFSPPEPPDWYILQARYGMFGSRERRLHFGGKPEWQYQVRGVPVVQIFKGERVRKDDAASTGTAISNAHTSVTGTPSVADKVTTRSSMLTTSTIVSRRDQPSTAALVTTQTAATPAPNPALPVGPVTTGTLPMTLDPLTTLVVEIAPAKILRPGR